MFCAFASVDPSLRNRALNLDLNRGPDMKGLKEVGDKHQSARAVHSCSTEIP